MNKFRSALPLMGILALLAGLGPALAQKAGNAPKPAETLRLYALDCGLTEFEDAGYFSDTGDYEGKSLKLPTPCYLVRHGTEWLLWDTGNSDKLAGTKGQTNAGGRFTVKHTLASQLTQLGLKPDDIRYVALSHLHQDHTGNIGLFPHATFLISKRELAWARGPEAFGVDAPSIAPLSSAKVEALEQDKDVFGDGSVQILKAPGHTPGGAMLMLRLPNSGPLLISGDLYHTRENYEKSLVPSINTSRAETLASMNRFKGLTATSHARIVVQHAPEDFAAMPAFPKYLD